MRAKAIKLTADGDEALYLKWQEFLKVEIAAAFDISPQNLGVERDVNRSTGEVAEDRDWDQAIKPCAGLLASHINRDAIEGRLGFSQIEFRFVGLDREDEIATSKIFRDRAARIERLHAQPDPRGKTGRTAQRLIAVWSDHDLRQTTQIALNAARGAEPK